jgi:CheY-like chemotaxis protein
VPQVLSLNTVIHDLEKMLAPLIGEHIRMTIQSASDLGAVRVDASQIEQVIVNLAINARDAMPNGGRLFLETQNVEFSSKQQDGDVEIPSGRYVLLKVSDSGIGMDESTKSLIFEPFFTTKERGKGTGLGLSMVYGIIKQSDGFISVNSQPGSGASFSIYLPRVDDEPSPPGTSSTNTSSTSTQAPRGDETVLLVEDDAGLRELARNVLSACGYSVLVVDHGNEAEQLCQERRGSIQLLVTDILMPDVNGVELARRLTQHCPEMRVLFMSGYSEDSIVPRGVIEPGTHFLAKPFTPSALAAKVRDILDKP